jgi:hypothetical protein
MTSAFVRRAFALVTLGAAIACGSSPTAADQTAALRLTATIDRKEIAAGASATASFRLENVGASAVTLHFNSGCQLLPYVERRSSQQIVFPPEGWWGCTAIVTELFLAPGDAETRRLTILAGSASDIRAELPPGEYGVFARVESREYTIESARVPLTVR